MILKLMSLLPLSPGSASSSPTVGQPYTFNMGVLELFIQPNFLLNVTFGIFPCVYFQKLIICFRSCSYLRMTLSFWKWNFLSVFLHLILLISWYPNFRMHLILLIVLWEILSNDFTSFSWKRWFTAIFGTILARAKIHQLKPGSLIVSLFSQNTICRSVWICGSIWISLPLYLAFM